MNLKQRLAQVSQNNIAYIEVYGPEYAGYYTGKFNEIRALPEDQMLIEIEKLEAGYQTAIDRENQKRQNEIAKKAQAIGKLKALGLGDDELEALGIK